MAVAGRFRLVQFAGLRSILQPAPCAVALNATDCERSQTILGTLRIRCASSVRYRDGSEGFKMAKTAPMGIAATIEESGVSANVFSAADPFKRQNPMPSYTIANSPRLRPP